MICHHGVKQKRLSKIRNQAVKHLPRNFDVNECAVVFCVRNKLVGVVGAYKNAVALPQQRFRSVYKVTQGPAYNQEQLKVTVGMQADLAGDRLGIVDIVKAFALRIYSLPVQTHGP
jgi:hypothetical protein